MCTKSTRTSALVMVAGLWVTTLGCDDGQRRAGAAGLGEGPMVDEPEDAGENEDEPGADDTGTDDTGSDDDGGDDLPPDDFPEPGQQEPEVPFDLDKKTEVCARGNGDRVAQALCSGANFTSMSALVEGLGFHQPFFSMTANSSSLVGRDVSALNPRLIVGETMQGAVGDGFDQHGQGTPEQMMAMGFVRGEQLVELVGYDPNTDALNFYLLMFEQACNDTDEGCQTSDLVSPAIESNWSRWTVYQDTDLVNTSLDCNVCHQPLGPNTPKVPRLQEISNSWTHWFPVRPAQQGGGWSSGGTGTTGLPPTDPGNHGTRSSEVLWTQFMAMHGDDPTYGGVPLTQIQESAAGPDIETFVRAWVGSREDIPDALRLPAFGSGAGNDFFLDSASMEREGAASSWGTEQARVIAGERLPLPSHRIDITSDLAREEVIETYKAVQSGAMPAKDMVHPSAAIAYTAMSEMSLVPEQDATAEQILTHMCARCHNGTLDPSLSRARFDATALGELDDLQKAVIADRIQRHDGDKFQMPPRRSGTLPQWAVTRVLDYLGQ
ncbi:MAG: c-type cytochrome [Nannocystaceae bacterium]|nr:hypothetical protein [bacterium]